MKWTSMNRIRWRSLAIILAVFGLLSAAWLAVSFVAAALVATVIAHYSAEMTEGVR
jgi:hypothetical protein